MAFELGAVIAKLKLDASNFKDGIKTAQSGLNSFKDGLSQIRNASLVVTGALTGVAVASLKLGETAGKYESIRDAFGSMTKEMGIGVEDFEKKVADASRGTLDRLTILQGGTRALSLMGKEAFSDFGTQFADMAALSKKAARATGQDVNYMFDSLITGMSRESKMILDNLGITVDLTQAKKDYAEELSKSVDELTISEEKTAVLQHTLGKLNDTYGDVAVSSGGFAGGMASLKTEITNAKIEIGTALLPVLNDLVRAITPLIKEYLPPLLEGIKQGIEWFRGLNPEVQILIGAFLALAPVLAAVIGFITIFLIPVITALLSPIGLVIAIVIALATAWTTNFLGIRDITKKVIDAIIEFFNTVLVPRFQSFVEWFTERWDFIKNMIQGTWNIIKGIIEVAWAIIYSLLSIGIALLTGDWEKAWERVKSALKTAWDGIKNIFSGIIEYIKGWGGMVLHELVKPFEDAWNKIKEIVEKIKDKLDFTKRHSPSILDIVNRSVKLANNALGNLDFNIGKVEPMTMANAITPSGAITNINISLDGAIIANEAAAEEISEKIGDNIIKKLERNVRM